MIHGTPRALNAHLSEEETPRVGHLRPHIKNPKTEERNRVGGKRGTVEIGAKIFLTNEVKMPILSKLQRGFNAMPVSFGKLFFPWIWTRLF